MFESITAKFEIIFKKLKSRGLLTNENIVEGLREIKLALLEADVNFKVVKEFIDKVKERALGQRILDSITPGQQIVKIVHDELCKLMGEQQSKIYLSPNSTTVIMMVGLQGSGKTTTSGKLASFFNKNSKKVLLVAADMARPAAIEQLCKLGEQIGVEVYKPVSVATPTEICQNAMAIARNRCIDVVILDTAGRMHIDEELMEELKNIKVSVNPHETLLVVDGMTGQDAVNLTEKFHSIVGIDGVILTKMDGDARGGAVLSIKSVTQKPIKFIGVGEKLDALEPFHPDRMASRILGMGDIISLVEKAETALNKQQAIEFSRKIQGESFTLEDFRQQLDQIRKLGSLNELFQMLPGGNRLNSLVKGGLPEKELMRINAIISSMTKEERGNYAIINGSRRIRIAKGSGTKVEDVNRLLRQFVEAKKMVKMISKNKGKIGLIKEVMRWQ